MTEQDHDATERFVWKDGDVRFHDRLDAPAPAPERPIGLGTLRRTRELTQMEMAERLDVDQAQISRLERRGDVKLSTIRSYLAALGATLIELTVTFPDGTIRLPLDNPPAARPEATGTVVRGPARWFDPRVVPVETALTATSGSLLSTITDRLTVALHDGPDPEPAARLSISPLVGWLRVRPLRGSAPMRLAGRDIDSNGLAIRYQAVGRLALPVLDLPADMKIDELLAQISVARTEKQEPER